MAESNGKGLLPHACVWLGCWSVRELAIGSPGCWGLWHLSAVTVSLSQITVTPWRRWPSWCPLGSLPSLSWLLFLSSPSSSGRLGFEKEGLYDCHPHPILNPQHGMPCDPPALLWGPCKNTLDAL